MLLVKCNDFVNGRRLHLGHVHMLTEGVRLGLQVQDLIVHSTGTGPGVGSIHTQERAARAHSYLLVFRRPMRSRVTQ